MIKKYAFLLLTLASLGAPSVSANASTKQLFGYYTNWDDYGRHFAPENIPMDQVSAILYAFAQVGNCAAPYADDNHPTLCNSNTAAGVTGTQDYLLHSTDPWADYSLDGGLIYKTINLAHQKNKKALLSIGGWTLSVPLTTAMDQTHQQTFITSIIKFLKDVKTKNNGRGFDGVDIDWEPTQNQWKITPQQFSNYLSFLSNLHAALKTNFGSNAWLTVAITSSPAAVNSMTTSLGKKTSLQTLAKTVNYINIMAYDYHGFFDTPPISNFLAPLLPDPQEPTDTIGHGTFNVQKSVQAYLNAGVPSQQLVVGFPLYSRSVNILPVQSPLKKSAKMSIANAYPGLYQTFNLKAIPAGEWGDDGVWDYKMIQTNLLKNGYTEYSYPVAKTIIGAFAFNPKTNVFMSYDNVDSLTAKIQFVQKNQLGGMMAWELSGDLPATEPKSLIALAASKLNN